MGPSPSSSVGGLQHPSLELRTIQGWGSPRSILALLFPALGMAGELPGPLLTVQTRPPPDSIADSQSHSPDGF